MALTTYLLLERIELPIEFIFDEHGTIVGVRSESPEGQDPENGKPEAQVFFTKRGAFNAHSTEQALRLAGTQYGSGTFVAVSERSWKEETLEVETTTRVKIA